jgi:heme iron utilization protein
MTEDRASVALAGRGIIRRSRSAALATSIGNQDGHPYASFVTVACDMDGSPVMLFSELADHTQNLSVEPRASLLFEATSRRRNPQTGPRVTLSGKIRKTKDKRLSARFLARHPDAALYAGFGDFAFYKMTVDRAHWVGGFAKARWLGAKHFMYRDSSAINAIAEAEASVLEHMNADHSDALDACAQGLGRRRGLGWRMIGLDPEGFDLCCDARFFRLDFDEPVRDANDCRKALVEMAKQARIKLDR